MKDQGCPYDQPLGHPALASSPPQQQLRQGQMTQQLAHQAHQQGQQQTSLQSQQHLSRQSQTVSGGSSTPPSSSGEPRKISCEDIQQVQNLIERCLQLYMNQKEVVNTLLNQAKIEPGFTGLVWQKLEEQNPDFFKAYYTRLIVKQQITKFNELLQQQSELMEKLKTTSAPSPISNGLHSSPMKHAPVGYPGQQPVMPTQRIHNIGCNLVPSNPPLINGGACLPNAVQANDNAISSGRMEIPSNVSAVLHGHANISPGNELAMQSASGFSNNSNFSFGAVGNPTDMHNTLVGVSVLPFNSNEAHPSSGVGSLQDTNPGCQKDSVGFLGQIPRNFSLSDLTADLTSDILGSYSGYPFLTPDTEAFFHSPEKECLDDGRMLETISEHLSYEDFPSDG